MNGARYAQAFVNAVAHKFSVEVGATVSATGPLTAVTYPEELHHPWPRTFHYRTEVFAAGDSPEAEVAGTRAIVDEVEHVLNVFRPADALADYIERGYEHAWTNVVLRAPVPHEPLRWPDDVTIVADAGEVAEANSIAPDNLCNVNALADSSITDLVARQNERVVAKAQVVTLSGEPAYVSDMFTATAARGRGHGGALLGSALEVARRSGATEAILVPSLSTRQSGFYEKRGFSEVLPVSLLIPAQA